MTLLVEELQSPLKTMSGAMTRSTPSPMKRTMKMMTKIWNMQTYLGFSLQMPYMPSAAPRMIAVETPKAVPSMIHLTEELPRKTSSLKIR